MSGRLVKGSVRYGQIGSASHWIPLDPPDRLNQLLIEWLGSTGLNESCPIGPILPFYLLSIGPN
jgi:hypothetical protein